MQESEIHLVPNNAGSECPELSLSTLRPNEADVTENDMTTQIKTGLISSYSYPSLEYPRRHYVDIANSIKTLLGGLPSNGEPDEPFIYRGLRANPPEITKRGLQRGNYAGLL